MKRSNRLFDKWRQGSTAAGDPAIGEYNSENAQVFENGTLGPRPGWKLRTATAGTKVWDASADAVNGFEWYLETDDAESLVVMFDDAGTEKYDVLPIATLAWASGASIDDLNSSGLVAGSMLPANYDDTGKYPSWNDGSMLTALGPYLAVSTSSSIGTPKVPIVALTHITVGTSTTVFTVADPAGLAAGVDIDVYDSAGSLQDSAKTIDSVVGSVVTMTDALAGTPTAGDLVTIDGTTLNADGYPSGATIYRERAYYWGYDSVPGRVYYSEPADYEHVSTLSSFDINIDVHTYAGTIVGMWALKGALLIARKDDTWLVLTGTSPENGTLRELGKDVTPVLGSAVVIDNQLFFLSKTGQGVVVATPSFVETTALEYMSPTAYPGSTDARPDVDIIPQQAVGGEVSRAVFLPARKISDAADIVAVERVNGVFNLSRWDYDAKAPEDVLFTRGRPGQLWALVNNDDPDWEVYSRDHTLNRPANSGDARSVALTNEAGVTAGTEVVVDLGEIVAAEGHIARPAKVVLDIDYWKGGNYSAPELAIDATVLGTEATTPEDTLAQQVVTTTGWVNSVGDLPYKRRVAVALPLAQYGTRFRIRITYDNLALDGVQVYYDEETDSR